MSWRHNFVTRVQFFMFILFLLAPLILSNEASKVNNAQQRDIIVANILKDHKEKWESKLERLKAAFNTANSTTSNLDEFPLTVEKAQGDSDFIDSIFLAQNIPEISKEELDMMCDIFNLDVHLEKETDQTEKVEIPKYEKYLQYFELLVPKEKTRRSRHVMGDSEKISQPTDPKANPKSKTPAKREMSSFPIRKQKSQSAPVLYFIADELREELQISSKLNRSQVLGAIRRQIKTIQVQNSIFSKSIDNFMMLGGEYKNLKEEMVEALEKPVYCVHLISLTKGFSRLIEEIPDDFMETEEDIVTRIVEYLRKLGEERKSLLIQITIINPEIGDIVEKCLKD